MVNTSQKFSMILLVFSIGGVLIFFDHDIAGGLNDAVLREAVVAFQAASPKNCSAGKCNGHLFVGYNASAVLQVNEFFCF